MTFGRRTAATVLATTVVFAAAAAGAQEEFERTPAPSDASVRIISPQDGATVSSPVTVIFGLSGMGVAPAGVQHDNTGHHHLMVNREVEQLPVVRDGEWIGFLTREAILERLFG